MGYSNTSQKLKTIDNNQTEVNKKIINLKVDLLSSKIKRSKPIIKQKYILSNYINGTQIPYNWQCFSHYLPDTSGDSYFINNYILKPSIMSFFCQTNLITDAVEKIYFPQVLNYDYDANEVALDEQPNATTFWYNII